MKNDNQSEISSKNQGTVSFGECHAVLFADSRSTGNPVITNKIMAGIICLHRMFGLHGFVAIIGLW
jgi:hypothetical protein